MNTLLVPAGFPAPGELTGHRRVLDAVVAGTAPAPPYVQRLAVPRPAGWSPGQVWSRLCISDELTWLPGVVFGGYAGCLVDMMAGLATLTVLPDGRGFLTGELALDFRAPLQPMDTELRAAVVELNTTRAVVEVVIEQASIDKVRGLVTQFLRVG